MQMSHNQEEMYKISENHANMYPMPPAGVKILFLLGWMDVVVARSRQVVVLAM